VSDQVASGHAGNQRSQDFARSFATAPDGGGADQPTFAEIDKAAKKVGIKASYFAHRFW
jgi:sulfide:quinone oxidoreductase